MKYQESDDLIKLTPFEYRDLLRFLYSRISKDELMSDIYDYIERTSFKSKGYVYVYMDNSHTKAVQDALRDQGNYHYHQYRRLSQLSPIFTYLATES